jgi:uncharacterized protein YcbK (DUF882 family)
MLHSVAPLQCLATSRRRLLRIGAVGGAAIAAPLLARAAPLAPVPATVLRMRHLHTGERITLPALEATAHAAPPASLLQRVSRFLRDHYSGDITTMDPGLLAQLQSLQQLLRTDSTIEIISGYRSPTTNERLRRRGGGGVASRSLHLEGRALDIRFVDVPLADLRDAALSLRAGGVGYYAKSDFVHIDTGRVRRWG